MLFFLMSYPLLGAGIKFIDEAFDDHRYSKKLAILIAPLLGVLWAYTMLIDPASATILLAVLVGVFFTGKIDNLAHIAGLLVILGIVFLAGVQLLWIPLLALSLGALLDEFGNDFVDKRKDRWNTNRLFFKVLVYFFDHRWMMKVTIFGLALFGFVPFYFFLAMVLFDEAYVFVRWVSHTTYKLPSFSDLSTRVHKAKAIVSTESLLTETVENINY